MELILASASPRRKKLLKQLGLNFVVQPSTIDEAEIKLQDPIKLVKKLSYLKAKQVYKKQSQIVIAADTVVSNQNSILEKPVNEKEAREMLTSLSGSTHQVLSGITIINGETSNTDYERTNVSFKELTSQEIDDYIATREPFDKAGAYGIQGKGAVFVKKIEGCFYNVMGLSLYKLVEMMREVGLEIRLDG